MVTLRVLNILMPFVWFSFLFDHFFGPFSFLFFLFFFSTYLLPKQLLQPGTGGLPYDDKTKLGNNIIKFERLFT